MLPSRHFFNIALLVSIAATLLPCAAQDGEKVAVRFVSLPKSDNHGPIEFLIGEEKTILVELSTNSLSPVYMVDKLPKWTLGKTVEDKEGNETFQAYGETPALTSTQQLILVTRDGQADSDGLTLVPFNMDSNGFGGGKYLFVNATKLDISGEVGDSEFSLKPNEHLLLAPEPNQENADRKYLFIKLYSRKGEKNQPLYSSTWRFSEKARSMVFFHYDINTDHLRIHTIRDYLP